MENLKLKTINGLVWSFVESFSGQGLQFLFGIVLARLLTPREFGLIGMLAIFIAISQTFVDSGMGNALIRKKNCTSEDYSTVFYFNLAVSVLFTLILILFAGLISDFFDEPELRKIIPVLSIGILINGFGVVQKTILTKSIDYYTQAKISIIASLISGTVSIILALNGFTVWSLVWLILSRNLINTILLWLLSSWKPLLLFSINSFKELFGFGSKLLLSGLLNTVFDNIYYLIIGKFFSPNQLGQYTQADQFRALPSQHLMSIVGRVSYPVLASLQDNKPALKSGFIAINRSTMFVTFTLMFGMAAVSKPMILVILGEQWTLAAEYLQLLCFVGLFYPIHAINLNILNVFGRSDLFLRLEVIKKVLSVPVILIAIFFGIKPMIIGMIILSIVALYLNSYWTGSLLEYSFKEQLSDILPSFVFAVLVTSPAFFIGLLMNVHSLIILITQIILMIIIIIVLGEMKFSKDYMYIKTQILEKWRSIR